MLLRARYNEPPLSKAENLICLKQKFYEQGEKSSKLLAWQIKKLQSSKAINNILTNSGTLSSDPMEINGTNFFQSLYRAESSGVTNHQTVFLDGLQIPSFTDNQDGAADGNLSTVLSSTFCVFVYLFSFLLSLSGHFHQRGTSKHLRSAGQTFSPVFTELESFSELLVGAAATLYRICQRLRWGK